MKQEKNLMTADFCENLFFQIEKFYRDVHFYILHTFVKLIIVFDEAMNQKSSEFYKCKS